MDQANPALAFERPIWELQARLAELKKSANSSPELEEEIRRTNRQLADLTREIYGKLTPWETVQVARHKDRPQTSDYLSMVFDEFVELHGDRLFGDDRALICGFAKLGQYKVLAVGHQKGRTTRNAHGVLLRLRPSGRLSQGSVQNEAGGEIPPAGDLLD